MTAALAALMIGILSCQAGAQEPIAAVLKVREVGFFYRSSRVLYPCYQLRNRVANILLAIGARDDIKVMVTGCEDVTFPQDDDFFDRGSDPFESRRDPFETRNDPFRNRRSDREQSAHVRVQLMMPVPVTPEVMAEIDRDKSRRELVSRVTGNKSAAMNDPIIFPALRQQVTLSRKLIDLEAKDCELLEQMSRSLFRELDVRVVRGSGMCDSQTTSRISPQITVEALLAVRLDQKIPGSEQLGADPSAPAEVPATEAPPSTDAPPEVQPQAPPDAPSETPR